MSPPATPPWKGFDALFIASAGEALGSLLSFSDGLKECAGPKTAANDELSNPVFDVKKPVDELDGRWFLQKYRGLNWRRRKHIPLSNTQTRRVEVVPSILTKSLTPVANMRTGNNAFRFQKVSPRNIFQQPTVRASSHAPSPLGDARPDFANDNEPLREAA